jgi:hypothetical protein
MLNNDYQYALVLFSEDQKPIGQASVKVDWEPARECAEFEAIRKGHVASGHHCDWSVVPIWQADVGEPYIEGFRIAGTNGAGELAIDFGTAYFKALAVQASSHFVEKGVLKEGDRFSYAATAFPVARQEQREPRIQFTTEEVTPPLAIAEASLARFTRGTSLHGHLLAEDMPVFVPRLVLEEAAELSLQAGGIETGGILIGHLHRDSSVPEVFAEVTAQVPARHTEADATKLTFTADTWTDVRAAIELRRKGELMLGWWHSHPVREWCKNCEPEKQRVCRMASDFFSAHDHALHRTVFPRAYSVALVVNNVGFGEPTFSMFGWRRGLLESRGFQIRESEANEAITERAQV